MSRLYHRRNALVAILTTLTLQHCNIPPVVIKVQTLYWTLTGIAINTDFEAGVQDVNRNLGYNEQGRSFPRIPQSRRILAGYRAVGYWRAIATKHNTHLIPIVASNVIFVPRRTAKMASKQILNPMRRAIAQKARSTPASVCFQCQRRWQSKVSQRPGSDRYAWNQQSCAQGHWLTAM